jgi:sortase A
MPRTTGGRIADGIRLALRTVGELMMTFGVIILLFVVYELYFTGIATRHDQHQLQQTFTAARGTQPSATPALGDGIAEMFAPRLGKSWHFIVVEGTGTDQLAKGPGHYEFDAADAKALGLASGPYATQPLADGSYPTAFPGHIGNFVVSGHRTTHAHPFFDANEFQPGDAVIFETTTTWFVYRVTGSESVLPSDVAVAYPVPGKAGAVPTQKLLTLTTCNPRYSATHRLVIHAVLVAQQPLSAGNPAALTTGRA